MPRGTGKGGIHVNQAATVAAIQRTNELLEQQNALLRQLLAQLARPESS